MCCNNFKCLPICQRSYFIKCDRLSHCRIWKYLLTYLHKVSRLFKFLSNMIFKKLYFILVFLKNDYFFIFSYPFNGVSILKCILWVFGIIFGIAFGKIFIHNWLFCKKLRLKIFTTEGQGSWLVILLVTCCILFFQASVYNSFLTLMGSDYMDFICTSNLHIENKSFMKGAALFAWIGNFFTVWMILDTMLQVSSKEEKKVKYLVIFIIIIFTEVHLFDF